MQIVARMERSVIRVKPLQYRSATPDYTAAMAAASIRATSYGVYIPRLYQWNESQLSTFSVPSNSDPRLPPDTL